jgi:phosphoglycolate phosphatase-like HAD superfamily hydrolase
MKSIVFDFDGVLGNTKILTINFLTNKFLLSHSRANKLIQKSMFSYSSDNFFVWVLKKYFYRKFYNHLAISSTDYLFQNQINELDKLLVPKAIISHNHTQSCINILGKQKSKFQAIYGKQSSCSQKFDKI